MRGPKQQLIKDLAQKLAQMKQDKGLGNIVQYSANEPYQKKLGHFWALSTKKLICIQSNL
jgi:hypothetical protein